MELLLRFLIATMELLNRIIAVIQGFQAREADLRNQLADALANDASDAAAIEAAKAEAAVAEAKAAELQALADSLQGKASDLEAQQTAIAEFLAQFEQPA